MICQALLFFCACFVAPSAAGLGASSVLHSGEANSVNLVQVDIRGVTYGRCSFIKEGNILEVMFEDRNGKMMAQVSNPTVLDPVSKAEECIAAAAKPQRSASTFRSDIGEKGGVVSATEIEQRLNQLQYELASNQRYISNLAPRFGQLGMTDSTGTNTITPFGIQVGGSFTSPLAAASGFSIDSPFGSNNLLNLLMFPFTGKKK